MIYCTIFCFHTVSHKWQIPSARALLHPAQNCSKFRVYLISPHTNITTLIIIKGTLFSFDLTLLIQYLQRFQQPVGSRRTQPSQVSKEVFWCRYCCKTGAAVLPLVVLPRAGAVGDGDWPVELLPVEAGGVRGASLERDLPAQQALVAVLVGRRPALVVGLGARHPWRTGPRATLIYLEHPRLLPLICPEGFSATL